MLELAIVLPLYVLIFVGVIDIAQSIRQHTIFQQLVSNVGSLESRVAELEPNTVYTNVHTGSLTGCAPASDCPGHRLVQDQFRRLISLHGWNVGPGEVFTSLNLESRYVPFNIGNSNSDYVTLTAWGTYSGVIPAVARTISASVQYPYLYDDVTGFGLGAGPHGSPLDWNGFTNGDDSLVFNPNLRRLPLRRMKNPHLNAQAANELLPLGIGNIDFKKIPMPVNRSRPLSKASR